MASPTTTMSRTDLLAALQRLRMHSTAQGLDDFLARGAKQKWTPEVLLEELVRAELRERERRSLETRLSMVGTGRMKPMADFDWNWPKKIDRPSIERALSGELIKSKESLVLVAAQGLGKTTIAKNIAHQAVLNGHSALFVEASKMLLDLGGRESTRQLARRIRYYTRPDVLCIDEIGYLSYDGRAADLLYEIITRRHGEKSIVVTTNLAFQEWPTVFPNASCVAAMVDRLIEHADIVQIEGESYRKREAEERKKARAKRAKA
jgi:DNA replication protein DnaC